MEPLAEACVYFHSQRMEGHDRGLLTPSSSSFSPFLDGGYVHAHLAEGLTWSRAPETTPEKRVWTQGRADAPGQPGSCLARSCGTRPSGTCVCPLRDQRRRCQVVCSAPSAHSVPLG